MFFAPGTVQNGLKFALLGPVEISQKMSFFAFLPDPGVRVRVRLQYCENFLRTGQTLVRLQFLECGPMVRFRNFGVFVKDLHKNAIMEMFF